MRFLAAFGLALAATATAASPDGQQADEHVTVVEANKSYTVKLDCAACPLAVQAAPGQVEWQTASRDNANVLLLNFDMDVHGTALLLNGKRVLPLDPMPLDIMAVQLAANNETFDMAQTTTANLPNGRLQYEHAVLPTKQPGQFWVQLDVTGWLLEHGAKVDTVRLDKEGQQLVQLLLRNEGDNTQLRIEHLQLVDRNDRVQPYRMKCGKLAVVHTAYDPAEWDAYGKLGSWSRLPHLVFGKLGDFWLDNFQQNGRVFLLALWLAITVFLVRRWQLSRQQERQLADEEDAEVALSDFQYTMIPVIKIVEYD